MPDGKSKRLRGDAQSGCSAPFQGGTGGGCLAASQRLESTLRARAAAAGAYFFALVMIDFLSPAVFACPLNLMAERAERESKMGNLPRRLP